MFLQCICLCKPEEWPIPAQVQGQRARWHSVLWNLMENCGEDHTPMRTWPQCREPVEPCFVKDAWSQKYCGIEDETIALSPEHCCAHEGGFVDFGTRRLGGKWQKFDNESIEKDIKLQIYLPNWNPTIRHPTSFHEIVVDWTPWLWSRLSLILLRSFADTFLVMTLYCRKWGHENK